jgi:hypothetical protein
MVVKKLLPGLSIRLQGGRERSHWKNQPQTVGRQPTKIRHSLGVPGTAIEVLLNELEALVVLVHELPQQLAR